MSLANRDLVTIDDFSYGEMEAVFSLADEMSDSMAEQLDTCRGKVMACLFFEPSTRTRLSFEAAMHRLGGSVISVADARASSVAKGESLADTARIVSGYADIIVIRHPWEGAARVVADYADVPVINAGDGGHQHPTQTLLDLYTLRKERKSIRGLKIALWGDLKYGRTIHSLIFALAKFGADILFCPSPGLEVPDNIIRKLVTEYGGQVERATTPERTTNGTPFPLDAVYMTPSSPHQLAMMPDVNLEISLEEGVDALYVTRPQKERFIASEEEHGLENKYPVVDKRLLKDKSFKRALVMHPLPRVDELAYDVDADPRSMYFKQAALGVPTRMALITLLLGAREVPIPIEEEDTSAVIPEYPVYQRDYGARCPNPACVSTKETEAKYLKSEFKIVSREPLTLRCVYCEHGFQPEYIASSDWHEGRLNSKRYHRSDSYWASMIRSENLIVFGSVGDAEANGFKPGRHEGKKRTNK